MKELWYIFTKNLWRKYSNSYLIAIIALLLFSGPLVILAQPSGGPYGPIPQVWELPDINGTTYFVCPNGDVNNPGTSFDRPTTIEAAFERIVSGDAIILRGGVYRTGDLILNQGITMQPYADEQPVLKGTYVADEWQDLGNGLWRTNWERLFPMAPADWWQRDNHGQETPIHRFNNDMVFADGRFLQSVGWEGHVDKDTYYVDYDEEMIYIGNDPEKHLIEITAFDVAINRIIGELRGMQSDSIGPVIRGIKFTQYAYRVFNFGGVSPAGLSDEADHGKDIIGTTLEHCTISFSSRVGGYFRGDSLTIRNCKVSDTSTEGIFILSSNDVLLERNIFTRNNIERITGYYPSAVKIFNQCYRVTVNDNLVIDLPYSSGIWYDVGNVDGVFTNNWIENVGKLDREFDGSRRPWPSNNGFFFEISKGATVAGNVFVNNDQGIYVINASDVEIYNNTLINSTLSIARTPRSAVGDHFGWHPSTGPGVEERYDHVLVNNLIVGDKDYDRPLIFVIQTPELCGRLTEPQLNNMDNNVYVKNTETDMPMILWSPGSNGSCQQQFFSVEEFNNSFPQFASQSVDFIYGTIPLFRSVFHGNLDLLPGFPGIEAATVLPGKVKKLLRLKEDIKPYLGAYPPGKK